MTEVICPYCQQKAEFVTGQVIYPHRPDLHWKSYWYCFSDDAYVGCHANSNEPLGRLADKNLRRFKINAHKAFDRLWKTRGALSRTQAYYWLSWKMNTPKEETHIGMFDLEQCKRVIKICRDVNLDQLKESIDARTAKGNA